MSTLVSYASSIASNFQNGYFIADFIVSALLVLGLTFTLAYIINAKVVTILYAALDLAFLLTMILNLPIASLAILMAILLLSMLVIHMNARIVREKFSMVKRVKKRSEGKALFSSSESRDILIRKIDIAVHYLSDHKIGAFITFEKNDSLDSFIEAGNGVVLDAPVVPELIEALFYEGSRLHDGAMVIRGDKIYKCGVFYSDVKTSSVRDMSMGARHRTAIGFSSQCDAISVVVSEETGRVSIAHDGVLDNVKLDEFERVFRNKLD